MMKRQSGDFYIKGWPGRATGAKKQGAYDYLTKPFNLDEVILSVKRALEKRRLELENRDYRLSQQLGGY